MPNVTKEYLIKTVYKAEGLKKFVTDTEKARVVAKELGTSLTNSARVVDQKVTKSFNKGGQEVRNVSTTFEQFGKKSTVAFKEVDGVIQKTNTSVKKFGDTSKKVEIDVGKLAKRALVTIPVWLALRSAITGVIFGLRDGFKNIISFDSALQKLKGNLQGTNAEVNVTLENLKKQFTDLSVKTGRPVEEIANAFQKFATVGFTTEEALTGATEATKLSIALFGNATETADAFARSLRILVDRSKGTENSQRQIAEAMALTNELWKTNQFDINEVNQSLEKFSAVAATSQLSMKETLTLLATLGTAAVGGARGGTLLRTSLQKLVDNLDEVKKEMGITAKETDTTFTVLTRIIGVLADMGDGFENVVQRSQVLSKVFGGVRGSLPIQALISMNDQLKKNIQVSADVEGLNKRVADVLDSESGQAKILSNAMREIAKSFVIAAVGGDNLKDSLITLNEGLADSESSLKAVGQVTGFLAKAIGDTALVLTGNFFSAKIAADGRKSQKELEKIITGLKGQLSEAELSKLIGDIEKDGLNWEKIIGIPKADKSRLLDALKKQLKEVSDATSETTGTAGVDINVNPTINKTPRAARSLENELNELKARLKARGATDIQLSLLDLDVLQSQSVKDLNAIRDAQSKIRIATIEKEISVQEQLLSAFQESLTLQGASNLEAIAKRIELEKDLGIQKTGTDLLAQQLELQKALTAESKKTRQERLQELRDLIKKTPSRFAGRGSDLSSQFEESRLRRRASFRGISSEQVERILDPEAQIQKSGLLNDLQRGLSDPMTRSMGSLESAISALTRTIVQQETRPTGFSAPRSTTVVVDADQSEEATLPNSKLNRAIQKVIDEF